MANEDIVPHARLVTIVALIEYGVALFLGLVTLLIGLPAVVDGISNPASGPGAMTSAPTTIAVPRVGVGDGDRVVRDYSLLSLAALRSRSSRPPHMKKACSGYVS